MGIKPLKKFGQNYLTDKNIVNKMIHTLNVQDSDTIIEIGPGKGFITEELYKRSKNIIGIEIDSRVISNLKDNFPELQIIHNDFVKMDFEILNLHTPIKIIGNIPFNQTGNILFKLLENLKIIDDAVLIIPFDLTKRIIAKKKTKEYGILTILFEYFSNAKLILKLSPNVFFPKPKIQASILHIRFDKKLRNDINKDLFIKVVKASFGNRRKTIINSFRNSIFKDCDFSGLEQSLSKRAEEFSVNDFLEITKYLQNQECLKKII
jgi:16S rRNA (adenine1518-N6/adenine1519-N6)-dimethyltransferase